MSPFAPPRLTLPLGVALSLLLSLFATATRADESIDFNTIERFARLSASVYDSIDDVEHTLPPGYTLIGYQTALELEIACLVVMDDASGDLVLAVRGTSNVNNALVDLAFKLRPDPLAGIKLHSGFALAASEIYKSIEPLLDRNKTIHTTGHSLGGAAALIIAMYLHNDDFKVGRVITFGQPKVTNIDGAEAYRALNVTRVVTPLDIVPLVPPFDPLDLKNIDIYWHLGREVVLYDDHSYSILKGLDAMLRAVKFTQRLVDEQNLNHHRMTQYHGLVANKTGTSTEVPFEKSLNLFNLFGGPGQ